MKVNNSNYKDDFAVTQKTKKACQIMHIALSTRIPSINNCDRDNCSNFNYSHPSSINVRRFCIKIIF